MKLGNLARTAAAIALMAVVAPLAAQVRKLLPEPIHLRRFL